MNPKSQTFVSFFTSLLQSSEAQRKRNLRFPRLIRLAAAGIGLSHLSVSAQILALDPASPNYIVQESENRLLSTPDEAVVESFTEVTVQVGEYFNDPEGTRISKEVWIPLGVYKWGTPHHLEIRNGLTSMTMDFHISWGKPPLAAAESVKITNLSQNSSTGTDFNIYAYRVGNGPVALVLKYERFDTQSGRIVNFLHRTIGSKWLLDNTSHPFLSEVALLTEDDKATPIFATYSGHSFEGKEIGTHIFGNISLDRSVYGDVSMGEFASE